MTDLAQKLADQGIRLRNHSVGEHATTCPKCSAQRKRPNQKKPCLGVKIDTAGGAAWLCHNCEWASNIPSPDHHPTRQAVRSKPAMYFGFKPSAPWGVSLTAMESAGPRLQRWPKTSEFRIAMFGRASESWRPAGMSGQSIGRAKEASI